MKDWFLTYFDKNYYKDYSDILTLKRTKREADFILKVLRLPKGSKILDLGCGQGRIAILLAKAGYQVIGIDTSKYLLKKAKQEVKRQNIKTRFILKDMRKIPFKNEYDGAICMLTSFGYFNERDNIKTLKNIANSLIISGIFLLDVGNPIWLIRNITTQSKKIIDNLIIKEKRSISSNKKIVRNKITYINANTGKRITTNTRFRQYTLKELLSMLSKCGLEKISVFGDYDTSKPLTKKSKRLIILSKRVL